ncbi:MAG: radical SAM protein [Thermodesulfobacteriota bacterium]|nr:radical SAM protein [Thermodesulfobacteriota bacterium]
MQGGPGIVRHSPIVIPVFVSNLGCPQRCVFCDQRQFSDPVEPDRVPEIVSGFLHGCSRPEERFRMLAFYGGTFTGIKTPLLERYLLVASSLVKQGVIHAIKASTRPDTVDTEILERLKDKGFTALELGAQSMDDHVLELSQRGHSAGDVEDASRCIKASGLDLGLQIMPGLPGEDRESFLKGIERIIELGPETSRIYPTVVMKGTRLEEMYLAKAYTPLDLDEAINRSLFAYIRFTHAGTRVLRMGLPPSKMLEITAGPYHPSFGFLVKSRGYAIMAKRLLSSGSKDPVLRVNPRSVSELLGYRRKNITELGFSFVADPDIPLECICKENTCLYFKDIIDYIL